MSEVSDVKYVIEHGWFYLLIFEIFDSLIFQIMWILLLSTEKSVVETGKNIPKCYRTHAIITYGLHFFYPLFQRIFH